jgi:hypothetical protein
MSAVRRSIRIVAVTAVAAAAILPGSAIAETPSSGTLPACAPGVLPTREQPCKLAPCAAGVYPKPGAPCALLPGALPLPTEQKKPGEAKKPAEAGTACQPNCPAPRAADGRGDGVPAGDDDKADEQAPRPRALMGGFLSRVWRFGADVDSYDAATNTLNVTVSKILNLPKRFKAQDDSIVDQDADVVFAKTTKVFDADGKRIRTESAYDAALDAAESVSVTGKITPQAKWNKDEDGTPVTTIRAKRVTITG